MGEIQAVEDRRNAPVIIRPNIEISALIEAQKATETFISKAFKDGVHCGAIPGTYKEGEKDKAKKVLHKPGMDLLMRVGNLVPEYVVVEKELDHDRLVPWKKTWYDRKAHRKMESSGESYGFYRYLIILRTPEGRIVSEAMASCSTMESKYVDRPRDCENTVLKMAQKRAKGSAIIEAYGLSNDFTVDIEDEIDPNEETATGTQAQKVDGYNPNNIKSRAWLTKLIESKGVVMDAKSFTAFSESMKGKTAAEINEALEGF
jgi:hypothetical protein